jgi:hypothetical protein
MDILGIKEIHPCGSGLTFWDNEAPHTLLLSSPIRERGHPRLTNMITLISTQTSTSIIHHRPTSTTLDSGHLLLHTHDIAAFHSTRYRVDRLVPKLLHLLYDSHPKHNRRNAVGPAQEDPSKFKKYRNRKRIRWRQGRSPVQEWHPHSPVFSTSC